MADSKDKQMIKKTDEAAEAPSNDATATKSKPSSIFVIFYLILLILFAAGSAAGGYYLWQQQQQSLQNQSAVHSTLQQQLSEYNSSVTRLKSQISSNAQIINDLKQQQTELSDIAQKAITITNRGQRDWVLAEVDYLLRMAHRRLQIGKDINSAIAAMLAADQRIYDLGDLSLFPVRKQLQNDIATLKSIHQVDVNGSAMAIDQMLEHLSTLPFKTINDEIKSNLDEPVVIENKKANPDFIDSVIDTVIKIGDIKIHNRSLQPVNNAIQQHQIEQTLRSHLLAARLSVLRYDQTQFDHDLKQCQNILQQYYNLSDNRVSQMQQDFSEFKKLNLSPSMPDINSSWSMLQTILAKSKLSNAKDKKPVTVKPKEITTEKMEAL